ncbi:S9 family peptidase [Nevskia sp.]|uniref:S9 family peptidase n=1 Tax=Nevskia sp. TaxID=1929292 RepID=UPI0025F23416|nr:S9 family peptidase [Nevskia sp.]
MFLPRRFAGVLFGVAAMSAAAVAAPTVAPFGQWSSPITPDAIVADTLRLGQVAISGQAIWWVEGRPAEAGRSVLMRRRPDGLVDEMTPVDYNVRTRAHEYGGGSVVLAGDTAYFANFKDQALYRQPPDGPPQAFFAEAGARFADAAVDAPRGRLIAVREAHPKDGSEAVNTVVAISLDGAHTIRTLVSGSDFFSSPTLSPDGRQIAWLSWSHPNMPWDGTTLTVGRFDDDGLITGIVTVAGGAEESVFQPSWSPDGELLFASDRSGWWNLYGWRAGKTRLILADEAEFGEPQWEFGMSRYGFTPDGTLIAAPIRNGMARLIAIDPKTGKQREISTPFSEIKELRVGDGYVAFLGGSATEARSLVRLDLKTGRHEILRRGSSLKIDPAYLSTALPIAFPTTDGKTAHAFFYPATSPAFEGPKSEKPPLIVLSHGGPTSQATATFNPAIQFWTSRGIGVVDVNYGGSSGYGREYRRRLNGRWGVVDIDDCVNAAQYLVRMGKADGARLAIRGGSAGGYTTLGALAFRPGMFKAGASYYGVGDLEVLARDTHKFESRYLDSLIGPYPEAKALYQARSPIHAVDSIASALILFQGLDDKVVPPNQSQMMFDAVKAKGLPVAYVPFPGEGHGFRAAAAIKRSLEAELYFYGRVFGFKPADALDAVAIENLVAD